MLLRLATLLITQVICLSLAFWIDRGAQSLKNSLLAVALFSGYVWFFWDWFRFSQILEGLRQGKVDALGTGGPWGDLAARIHLLIRKKDKKIEGIQSRLDEFLIALQASPNGIVLLDKLGRIEWFNTMASLHFGLESPRDLMQVFTNLMRHPHYSAYFNRKDFLDAVVIPSWGVFEKKELMLSVHLHLHSQGGYLLLSQDITASKKIAKMRQEFVANVSHEIRTPLTVLSGFIETMRTIELDTDQRTKYLDIMESQSKRMTCLVKDLLTLSLLEDEPLPSEKKWISMKFLLNQCIDSSKGLSEVLHGSERHIQFDCNSLIQISGNELELYSACFNLLANAVRYTPSNKQIVVNFKIVEDGGALLEVADHGEGIAQEHLGRLTERFYRVDKSRSRLTGGTGLGLAIVKHVVQRHGAQLNVVSTLGKGSTFSIYFPSNRVRLQNIDNSDN